MLKISCFVRVQLGVILKWSKLLHHFGVKNPLGMIVEREKFQLERECLQL